MLLYHNNARTHMTDKEKSLAKLDIKLGNLSFCGEGEQQWLTSQLEKLISAAGVLSVVTSHPNARSTPQASSNADGSFQDSLATYLRAKSAEKNQVMRFLATADWLRRRGEENLASGLIARALADNHQSRLANPSDCLNQNVAKGFCEKKPGGGFFITPEGLRALGHEE